MDRLLGRTMPMAHRMVRAYLGCREEGDDVLQRVLLTVWKSIETLREPASFGAWLARIVHRKALDHLRARHREVELHSYQSGITLCDCPTREGRDEFLDRLYEDLVRRLERIILTLPPRYREVLSLRLIDGLELGAIADRTGKNPATVRSLVSRGVRKLRENVEQGA